MINFERIYIFYLLYKIQSFSKTAEQIEFNQSIISRNIKDLEQSLNCKLILNNQKPLSLTKEGKALYKLTQQIYDDMDHICENMALQYHYNNHDKIKIFIAISMVLGCILAERIKKLLKIFPEIYVDISFTNTITMDLLNQKDIVITREPYLKESLVNNEFINSYEMIFGASKNYLAKRGDPKFATSLQYHDFIYIENYPYYMFALNETLDNIYYKYKIDNELAALQTISIGGGVGMFPKFVTNTFDNIVTFDLEHKLKPFAIYISYSKVKMNSYIALITDFLKNEL